MTNSRLGILTGFATIAIPMVCWGQSYRVTDLGTLGGSESIAIAINNSGDITGGARTAGDAAYHAFLYVNGAMKDLGTLGGPSSQGQAINRFGEVAGYAQLPPGPMGGYPPHPISQYSGFSDASGKMTAVGQPGGASYGINDGGEVVGECPGGACLFSHGNTTNLGNLGGTSSGTSQANGINSAGVVVGYSYLPDGNFRGFVWSNGTMTAIPTLGGDWSQAYAINDSGEVTGVAYTTGNRGNHAFLFANGQMKDLGTLGNSDSTGTSINSKGVVCGYASVPSSSEFLVYHAFVFTGSKLRDLNSMIPRGSGWVLQQANGINDAGQIVGYGTINGNTHGFLLTPEK